ncbi:MAG TPA: HutD family protein [Burkholderiaceae bacterium]|jgi:hypothetical protein|nr:HutD family protein [Burkholderiaceae bacterium]
MKLLRFDELPATPWRNGTGVTRELACAPRGAGLDDFVWRASIADVTASGPFSVFPGVDRLIVLLDGDGMRLEFADGRMHDLTQALVPYRFRGEDRVHARLAGSPSRDLNLMLRREVVSGDLRIWRDDAEIACADSSVLLFCARGRWEAHFPDGTGTTLDERETLTGTCGRGIITIRKLAQDGVLVGATITPHPFNDDKIRHE